MLYKAVLQTICLSKQFFRKVTSIILTKKKKKERKPYKLLYYFTQDFYWLPATYQCGQTWSLQLYGLKLVRDMKNSQVKHIKMITQLVIRCHRGTGMRKSLPRKAEPLFMEDMDWTLEGENSVPCRARVETLWQEQEVHSPWSRKEQRRPVCSRCSKSRRSHWEVGWSGHVVPPSPQLGAHT